MIDSGEIPVNVSVNVLDRVTAGFANEVDDVNQYPAVINKATEIATLDLLFFLTIKIVKINPTDAIISLKNMLIPVLGLDAIWSKLCSNMKWIDSTANNPATN
tara:strand:- start:81 stop:389 length:309 start_codon:yes stop_codon:yes gene_type:complete